MAAEEMRLKRYPLLRSAMEKIINIHVKKLPEGVYLATSQDVQGLVAQGRTATEALGKMGTSVLFSYL